MKKATALTDEEVPESKWTCARQIISKAFWVLHLHKISSINWNVQHTLQTSEDIKVRSWLTNEVLSF